MNIDHTQQNIIVGLSGGVDSSVTAALLKQQGYQVRGVFMQNWEDDDNDEYCSIKQDSFDAIAVADILYKHFPNQKEGFLTSTRSKIVQRETLNRIALEMGLDKMMVSTVRPQTHNSYILGNALEALIGAIYLDQGYRRCRRFVQERMIDRYTPLDKVAQKEVNFKSNLLEWGQKAKLRIAFVLNETSTDQNGNRMFQSTVHIEDVPFGTGAGYTKKESQQIAAKKAIKKIRYDSEAQTLLAELRQRALEARATPDVLSEAQPE